MTTSREELLKLANLVLTNADMSVRFCSMETAVPIATALKAMLDVDWQNRERLAKVLGLVSDIESSVSENDTVWGHDTDCGSVKELLDKAESIMEGKA